MTALPDPARPSSRIAGIEGLRGIAALLLVFMHLWWVPVTLHSVAPRMDLVQLVIAPLNESVPMFFVLSGFLLWRPFAGALIEARPLPSIRRYARNRALRILPAYWVVLLASAVVLEAARLTPATASPVDGAIHAPGLLLQDALLIQNLRPSTMSSGLTPAWSLAVEVVFYALLPLLGLCALRLASRRSSRRRRLAAALSPAVFLLLLGILGKLVSTYVVPGPEAVFLNTWHSVIDGSFLTHADLFAFGMLVAVLRVEHERGRFSLPRRALLAIDVTLGSLALPFLVDGFWKIPRYVFDPLIALLCAILLARIVLASPGTGASRLVRVLESRPFARLGLISYSVFLWNYPVAVFLTRHGVLAHPTTFAAYGFNLLIGVPVVLVLAAATYLAVERPALRIRGRAVRPAAPVPAARELTLTTP